MSSLVRVGLVAASLAACGPSASSRPSNPAPTAHAAVPSSTSPTTAGVGPAAPAAPAVPAASATPSTGRPPPPSAQTLFARLERDFAACVERGRKSTPEMREGRVTLHAALDGGRATCVIPTEDTGLTQEVEDCMTHRMERESFGATVHGTVKVPVAVRNAVVGLGEVDDDRPHFDSVETTRLPDSFDAIEDLLPHFASCTSGARQRGVSGVVAGARVARDGSVECALATSYGKAAVDVEDCAADVLRAAKFSPPTRPPGIVLIPLRLGGGSRPPLRSLRSLRSPP